MAIPALQSAAQLESGAGAVPPPPRESRTLFQANAELGGAEANEGVLGDG
jgi:hypothetical protein